MKSVPFSQVYIVILAFETIEGKNVNVWYLYALTNAKVACKYNACV